MLLFTQNLEGKLKQKSTNEEWFLGSKTRLVEGRRGDISKQKTGGSIRQTGMQFERPTVYPIVSNTAEESKQFKYLKEKT